MAPPDGTVLCDCWARATTHERLADALIRVIGCFQSERAAHPGPNGLLSCPKCGGLGYWLGDPLWIERRMREFQPLLDRMKLPGYMR